MKFVFLSFIFVGGLSVQQSKAEVVTLKTNEILVTAPNIQEIPTDKRKYCVTLIAKTNEVPTPGKRRMPGFDRPPYDNWSQCTDVGAPIGVWEEPNQAWVVQVYYAGNIRILSKEPNVSISINLAKHTIPLESERWTWVIPDFAIESTVLDFAYQIWHSESAMTYFLDTSYCQNEGRGECKKIVAGDWRNLKHYAGMDMKLGGVGYFTYISSGYIFWDAKALQPGESMWTFPGTYAYSTGGPGVPFEYVPNISVQ